MKMSGFFSSLSRSLSEEVKAYTNAHPIRGRMLGASTNTANSDPMSDEPKLEPVRVHPVDRSQSLPSHLVASGSISDASESGSPSGSPTAACLDSPTASAASQQQQQQQRKRQYKVHGMDPYDYWSLIKSL